jgi:chromosome segregation ATPase
MANPAAQVGNKRESLVDSLDGLEAALQKVKRSSKEVKAAEANAREVERLQAEMKQKDEANAREVERLQAEMKQKDKTIAENEVAHKALFDGFEAKAVEWQEKRFSLEQSLEAVKVDQISAISRQLDGPRKEAKTAKEEAKKAKEKGDKMHAKYLEADAQLVGFRIQLKNTRTELTALQNCTGLVESTEKLLVANS